MNKMRLQQMGIALISGILFGLGLGLSQMIDRERVLGFLDVAGTWDPTLLFVLGGAVSVSVVTFQFILRYQQPIFGVTFTLPTRQTIDFPLLGGAVLFGVGWGISGYCPGPGIVGIMLGTWNPVIFLVSLAAGMLAYQGYISLAKPPAKG